jgi:hypothetical protein
MSRLLLLNGLLRRTSAEEMDNKPYLDDTDRGYGILTTSHCCGASHDLTTAVYANEAEIVLGKTSW